MCRNAFRSNNKYITVYHIMCNNNKKKKIYNAHIVKHWAWLGGASLSSLSKAYRTIERVSLHMAWCADISRNMNPYIKRLFIYLAAAD